MVKKILLTVLIFLGHYNIYAYHNKNDIKIPILMYHKITPYILKSRLKTSPSDFDTQMKYLKENNYNPITFSDLLSYFNNKSELPQNPVIITFDDGYSNIYTYAYPILKKYGLKATIFMIAGRAGRKIQWKREKGNPIASLLGWSKIKEMSRYGIEFGSHTLSHPNLKKCSIKYARKQIKISKVILERNLKKPVIAFSYPYGSFNRKIKSMVKKAGYAFAVSTIEGCADIHSDLYALPRIRINGYVSLEKFKILVSCKKFIYTKNHKNKKLL